MRPPKRGGTPIHTLLLPEEQGLTVTASPSGPKGSVGAGGRDSRVGREPDPAATGGQPWGERWRLSSGPHSVPALGSLRKNSLFSFSIQGPERGTCGLVDGGGRKGGWSSLPLFLSCLSSPLAPDLCRLLAAEPEISARMGEGTKRCVPSSATACKRAGWALRGCCSATVCTCQTCIRGLANC